jgi:hypothetical protein
MLPVCRHPPSNSGFTYVGKAEAVNSVPLAQERPQPKTVIGHSAGPGRNSVGDYADMRVRAQVLYSRS